MKMDDIVVNPWQLVTVKLRCSPGWRYRWSLGFWLIKLGSHCISNSVEISVEGSEPRGIEPPTPWPR